jgi:beta-lactamase class A
VKRGRFAALVAGLAATPAVAFAGGAGADATFAALEARHGGRLGVAALDLGTGRRWEHRAGERFPLCSTFKLLATAAVLARVDAGKDRLDRRVHYGPQSLLAYAPVTREHAGRGWMTLGDLCIAAITLSDNTAANLLLESIGGPGAVTRYARSLGDPTTRLDRWEPTLNTAIPGDPRDTTAPAAMVHDMRRLLTGDALSKPSRDRLNAWLAAGQTGEARLRAGLPREWFTGDKTGSGANGSTNDVAIARPPRGGPLLIAAYYTGSTAPPAVREAVLASVARIVAGEFARAPGGG